MSDTSLVFNLVARDRTEAGLSQARERFDAAAAGIGAGAGVALGAGLVESLSVESAGSKLAAQLGLTQGESAQAGKVAGDLYAAAYGDSIDTVNTAVGAVMSSIKGMSSASSADLQEASAKALDFAKAFEIDVAQGVSYAGTLINVGLAQDATQAFDLITAASQKVPAHLREDVLEAANEYGQFFHTLGFNGAEAFSLLVDASQKGQFGIDKAGDAIKEFTILSTDMSASSVAAYETLKLDAQDMANAILAGGDTAKSATQKIINGLLGIKDPATQANTAIALFGTPLEDLNVKDIPAFLQSLKGASGSMDDFAGSSKKMGQALNDNSATALEEFKRKALGELAAVSGGFLAFAMDNQAVFVPLAYTLAGLAATVLVVKGAMITYSAVAAVVGGAHAVITASAWGVIGTWIRMNVIGLMAYARIAAGAVVAGATTAAAWTGAALVSIGTWIAAVVRAGVTSAAQFVLMAARAVIWAATMAAQWLIAMGPVGWIIAAVIALVALIVANWDTIKRWTIQAWEAIWGFIKGAAAKIWQLFLNWTIIGLVIKHWSTIKSKTIAAWNAIVAWVKQIPGWLYNAFLNWTLLGLVIKHWSAIKTATVKKALEMVAWVKGLPGRISSGIGSLRSLLTSKGRDVVTGLWSGISGMTGWIKNKIMSWAKSAIPGPVAKALGISSPSKVTAAQGRWIARGLVDGLTGSAKQVRAAAFKLADIVRDSLASGRRRSKALGKISTGAGQLIKLANKEASLASRIKAANKSLADQIKARDKLAADVRKGILDAANITSMGEQGQPHTAGTILSGLQDQLARARQFAADLAALRKKGVRGDLIAQIAQAGVEQGGATAMALANASNESIKQINSTQAQLVKAAGKAGASAGDAMYGAGINAAKGLVAGLKAQQRAIEAQMLVIARGMKTAIKRALGIRSPSTLMADEVGRWIPAGIAVGAQDNRGVLDKAMTALVPGQRPAAPTPLTSGLAPMLGGQATGGVVVVRFEVTGAEGEFKKFISKIVRVDGRGSVQTAFAGRQG